MNREDGRAPHIIVVGAGMGGLTVAATALAEGADVTVLEKSGRAGGSAALANGMLITYADLERLEREAMGGFPALQEVVHSTLPAAAEWLGRLGVELQRIPTLMERYHGWSFAPSQFIRATLAEIARLGGQLLLSTPMTSLIVENGRVCGVEVVDDDGVERPIVGDAVVLATGGFQGNPELLARYAGLDANDVSHRSNPWSTGDGLSAALATGAATSAGMGGFYGHAMPAPPARHTVGEFADLAQYYGSGSVAINMRGRRFIDETRGTFEENVNHALSKQSGGLGFYIFDAAFGEHSSPDPLFSPPNLVAKRAEKAGGTVLRADSLAELASQIAGLGVPEDEVLRTIQSVADAASSGDYSRLPIPRSGPGTSLLTGPFTAVHVRASITSTTGGLRVDDEMRVVRSAASSAPTSRYWITDPRDFSEQVVDGLYAVGSDLGGVSCGGYAGGLATALTTGRAAAFAVCANIIR
ncbi:FAD-dependent oxidoreductase [Streptomyces sp. NPDC058045]|uniref:FAD-dependent oxidoreductase n=1 Tax=Streptomyces sp. NPDC058045 TaxID=3346311 RepID=UPI0036E30EE0